MKNWISILLIVFISISCGKEKTISEELAGEWLYEREAFNSFSPLEDPDTAGFMSFRDDETGNWMKSNSFPNYDFEWDLQSNDQKIAMTKYLTGFGTNFPITTVYDLKRTDEDNFTLTNHFKFESNIDTIEGFEQFENIILLRMK